MQLTQLDWVVVAGYGAVALLVGAYFARRAGRGSEDFFLAGRKLPWWLLGTSMVATTFSTDTPNLVTDLVRSGGVSQNWIWWAFLITGMCTVFFYAKLWRRAGVLTDMGFYELRYSGPEAAFLRGFRAIYLGVFFNVMIMATVTLAAIKISGVLLGLSPLTTVVIAGSVTAVYSAASGLWGVVVTDLLLFVVAMIGSIAAAWFALAQPEVGGLTGLFAHPEVMSRMSFLPDFTDWKTAAAVFIIPISVQWWSTWYPGAEPGGGGYVAQRMLAARNEKEALLSTLWFNVAHYALRPWPWLLVALASLIIYPDLESIMVRFPDVDPSIVGDDMAYSAMLVFLPSGVLGLVVASLAAAYMSTVSTHLNWGASYVVDDVYRRFWAPNRDERHYVLVARITTFVLIFFAATVALWLETAKEAFQILLQIGAGSGLVFLLRWFWWRINAWTEIAAMVISFAVALYFEFVHGPIGMPAFADSTELLVGVVVTTVGWLLVTLATPPASRATLQRFYDKIHPMGRGWARVVDTSNAPDHTGELGAGLLAWFLGCATVYGVLFGTGFLLYDRMLPAVFCFVIGLSAGFGVLRLLPRTAREHDSRRARIVGPATDPRSLGSDGHERCGLAPFVGRSDARVERCDNGPDGGLGNQRHDRAPESGARKAGPERSIRECRGHHLVQQRCTDLVVAGKALVRRVHEGAEADRVFVLQGSDGGFNAGRLSDRVSKTLEFDPTQVGFRQADQFTHRGTLQEIPVAGGRGQSGAPRHPSQRFAALLYALVVVRRARA